MLPLHSLVKVTSPVRQMSSLVQAAAASPVTLCVTVRMTAVMAQMRWNVLHPPVGPVNSSVETLHASRPAGSVTTTLTAR